jgi:hypothetical protein
VSNESGLSFSRLPALLRFCTFPFLRASAGYTSLWLMVFASARRPLQAACAVPEFCARTPRCLGFT